MFDFRRTWSTRYALETPDALAREGADRECDIGGRRGDRVVRGRLDLHDARRLRRAKTAREGRAERDGDLAEDLTRQALAKHALDTVDDLDDLDPALQDSEQRALLALVHGVLAGGETDICAGQREPLTIGR